MPHVTRPIDPGVLLENAGNELHWTLRAAAEWERQVFENLAVPGYEVQVLAMDSTFLHARALFEFFTGRPNRPNYHSVTELDAGGIVRVIASTIYTDHWSDPLHDRLMHLKDRNSDPTVPTASGSTKHLKNMPAEIAMEVRRLWVEMIGELRAARLDSLATAAEDLLAATDSAVAVIRAADRRNLYGT